MKRSFLAVLSALMVLFSAAGCMETSADDLYALPQLSEGYLNLQESIDAVLSSGAEYATLSSGANRQPIQREDLDGDGVREVIAFFNFTGTDRPLKILIFQDDGGEYSEIARIEGEGSGIDCVSYLDMDSDGIREVAVGWQMGAGINMLSIYSIKGWQVNQLVNTNYSEFTVCTLDARQGSEVLVLRLSPSELSGEAEHYSLAGDGEVVTTTVRLSSGIEALKRVRSTSLLGGAPAVLVESTIDNTGIVTDLLSWNNGKFTNITMDENSGRSDMTLRLSYPIYCRDINADGIIDIPQPSALPAATEEDTTYYAIDWYSYYASGVRRLACTTYSNYTDSWYLILPDSWKGKMTVRREEGASGERMIIFFSIGSGDTPGTDFLAIYTLTGDNRAERATAGDRFILLDDEETVYAGRILSESALPITREQVKANFGLIYSEWVTGET